MNEHNTEPLGKNHDEIFVIENWLQHYNKKRPYSLLGYRPPCTITSRIPILRTTPCRLLTASRSAAQNLDLSAVDRFCLGRRMTSARNRKTISVLNLYKTPHSCQPII